MFNKDLRNRVDFLEANFRLLDERTRSLVIENKAIKYLLKGDYSLNNFFEKFKNCRLVQIECALIAVLEKAGMKVSEIGAFTSAYSIENQKQEFKIIIGSEKTVSDLKHRFVSEWANLDKVFKANEESPV